MAAVSYRPYADMKITGRYEGPQLRKSFPLLFRICTKNSMPRQMQIILLVPTKSPHSSPCLLWSGGALHKRVMQLQASTAGELVHELPGSCMRQW
ncbi:hypothetical protein ACFX13_043921 [Malus domestica]